MDRSSSEHSNSLPSSPNQSTLVSSTPNKFPPPAANNKGLAVTEGGFQHQVNDNILLCLLLLIIWIYVKRVCVCVHNNSHPLSLNREQQHRLMETLHLPSSHHHKGHHHQGQGLALLEKNPISCRGKTTGLRRRRRQMNCSVLTRTQQP